MDAGRDGGRDEEFYDDGGDWDSHQYSDKGGKDATDRYHDSEGPAAPTNVHDNQSDLEVKVLRCRR